METQTQLQTQSRRKALGRGLEELFNNEPMNYETIEEKIITSTPKEEIVELNLSELRSNPYQPRKNFDERALQELANSIKEYGVFQPIIVKKGHISFTFFICQSLFNFRHRMIPFFLPFIQNSINIS